ncbi:hypothetical protein MKW92_018914 [Papaver armeniacum]|nr:hypothetical protein MKW92_018914 [Papaver armeniacum]
MEEGKEKKSFHRSHLQKTFVLAYPIHFNNRSVGFIVSEFEKLELKIIEMSCMEVTKDFALKHVFNIEWDPKDGNWVDNIASDPVVAMVVEGDECMSKFNELISKKQLPFWVDGEPTVYSSNTWKQAQKDIGLWFEPVSFKDALRSSKKLVSVVPGGVYGPSDQLFTLFFRVFKDNFFMERMCVILINPLAFRNHCVGEILDAIEANCTGIRGLKLVKKPEKHSKAWDADSDSDGNEYGVAVVVYNINSNIKIVLEDPNFKLIDHDEGVFETGSNYLYKSEPDQEVLEAASEFFDYGFSVWAFPNHCMVRGCMFQASLIGLESLL